MKYEVSAGTKAARTRKRLLGVHVNVMNITFCYVERWAFYVLAAARDISPFVGANMFNVRLSITNIDAQIQREISHVGSQKDLQPATGDHSRYATGRNLQEWCGSCEMRSPTLNQTRVRLWHWQWPRPRPRETQTMDELWCLQNMLQCTFALSIWYILRSIRWK